MSKAEDRAVEKYPVEMYEEVGWRCVDKNAVKRECFVEGYHQAEKDLELSWEDIREIYSILLNVQGETSDDYLLTHSIPERIENEHREYKETLKRYFEWKNNKTVQQRIKENPND